MQRSLSFSSPATQPQLAPDPPNTASLSFSGIDVSKSPPSRNLAHVPCKFYRQGACQAGTSCPFSHVIDSSNDTTPCKYFQKGNCKFGIKCALAHILPDGRRMNPKSLAQVYQNHNIQNANNSNGYGAANSNSYLDNSHITSGLNNGISNGNSPIDIQSYSKNNTQVYQNSTAHFNATSTSPSVYQNYNQQTSAPLHHHTTPVRHSSFSYGSTTASSQVNHQPSNSFTGNSNIWSNTPNSTSTANTSPNIKLANLHSISIPTFQYTSSWKTNMTDHLSGSAIYDDDEDEDAYGENDVFEEDFVPSSLSDLLTPQELQRRGSRPSTNSKRPSFGGGVILETQFDME